MVQTQIEQAFPSLGLGIYYYNFDFDTFKNDTFKSVIEDVYLLIHFQKCHSWKCQNDLKSHFWKYLKITLMKVSFLKVLKSKVKA